MPPFKMKFDKASLHKPEPEPAGVYELRLIGFRPALAASGESYNLQPLFEFTQVRNHKGEPKKLWFAFFGNTSEASASLLQDFCHALGEEMEGDPNDPDTPDSLPGVWNGDELKFKEDDPKTWLYKGPLLNKTCKAELYIDDYQGKQSNKILRFFCDVPNCAERFPKIQHSTNMNWGKKEKK